MNLPSNGEAAIFSLVFILCVEVTPDSCQGFRAGTRPGLHCLRMSLSTGGALQKAKPSPPPLQKINRKPTSCFLGSSSLAGQRECRAQSDIHQALDGKLALVLRGTSSTLKCSCLSNRLAWGRPLWACRSTKGQWGCFAHPFCSHKPGLEPAQELQASVDLGGTVPTLV